VSRFIALFLGLVCAAPLAAEEGFTDLFNGRDLTGWRGNADLWRVENGAITGATKGPDHLAYNQFLIWEGEVADFELRLQFRLEGANNSGVQYRSQQLKEAGDFVIAGYQADIHPAPANTGMLYDERGRGVLAHRNQRVVIGANGKSKVTPLNAEAPKPIDLSEWREMTIIARGNRLIHKVDEEVTSDVTDNQPSARERSGLLALQVHRGPKMKVQFKNIRLRKLPAKRTKPAKAAGVRPEHATPHWIWLPGDSAGKAYFRKEFPLRGISSIQMYAAADKAVKVFVNEEQVINHNDPDQPLFVDLTARNDAIRKQENMVVAIEAESDGADGSAGVLLRIDLDSGWRETRTEVTDGSWRAAAKPAPGWKKPGFDDSSWKTAKVVADLGAAPWKHITAAALAAVAPLKEPTATEPGDIKAPPGFEVELLHSVPKGEQGSWVNLCVDPQGRLYASDQYGALYRLTPPVIGEQGELGIEKLDLPIGEAQGLLWAFDSLYVVVNRGAKYESGVYRLRDTDDDDHLDEVKLLRQLEGGATEHGPHAIIPAPDGKSLYIVCGNHTTLPQISESRVPQVWDEDLLLPRAFGRGFMKTFRAPGGFVAQIDPDGKDWTLVSSGFRNTFDIALNADGELFAYDADMELDMNTSWYRPTRVAHVVSGAEWGWRNGGGKWPVTYPDSLPPVVNIGPGSPTGVTFGYGAKFPAKFQKAFFINDWTYGKMYAVHLQPLGASYLANVEEFLTATPLPLTDVVINPHDGAMYFAIGGRRVQSGFYRVRYTGAEDTSPVDASQPEEAAARKLRRSLETLHLGDHPQAVKTAWPHLASSDRFIRYAARIAIEHRPRAEWQTLALREEDADASLTALLALARSFERTDRGTDEMLDTPPPVWGEANKATNQGERAVMRSSIFAALDRLRWGELNESQQLAALRVITLVCLRVGQPTNPQRDTLIAKFDPLFPSTSSAVNFELTQLLVYLQAPSNAEKTLKLIDTALTQEEEIWYVRTLRFLKAGWTPSLKQRYFQWFVKARGYRGGASFGLFVNDIKQDAVALLTAEERLALKPILEAPAQTDTPVDQAPRPLVKKWTMKDLAPLVETGLTDRNFEHGRQMFAAAKCFACHRFDNRGGAIGPDLTALSGRFSQRDILESLLEPSKTVSDQYQAVVIRTTSGKVITGRIVNFAGNSIRVNTDMLDPNAQTAINRREIDEIIPSRISMMPEGLLDTLKKEEILDLMAYLLSRGNPSHKMFRQK